MHLRMWFPLSPEPAIKAETLKLKGQLPLLSPLGCPDISLKGVFIWCLLRFLSLIKGFEYVTLFILGRQMRVFSEVVSYFQNRETFL